MVAATSVSTMHSHFTKSSSFRWGSVGTSAFVHLLVVGLLLFLGGPVWEAGQVRSVTKLTLPPRPAPPRPATLAPRTALRQPRLIPATAHILHTELREVLPRPTQLPAPALRPTPMRIEAPPDVVPVAAVLPPAMSMPKLVVKPAVQVGLLETASVSATPNRVSSGPSGFDSGAVVANVDRRVANVGFDDSSSGSPAAARRTLSSGGFDQVESSAERTIAKVVASTPFEGIEILEKPRPVYTEEARRLRIEGTVQLRVVFGAAGQIRVVGVVKGLGHGLDEAAVQAAEAIRFRPARREGRPVDAPAVIQIQFQIA